MGKSTSELRRLWKAFECRDHDMVVIPFGPDRIRVAPPTAPAFEALASVLLNHGYKIRTTDTDSYNCRNIKGTNQKSLHSYGVALDVNWQTNPFLDHAGSRAVRFSDKPTQEGRAEDVRLGRADTDMTPAMIEDVLRIATTKGVRVFEWGGSWPTKKDCMHFEVDLSPDDLAEGIDPATVAGFDAFVAEGEADAGPGPDAGTTEPMPDADIDEEDLHVVIARSGLHLRAGAAKDFPILSTLPAGTTVHVIARDNGWAQVDLQGDGLADGFVAASYLRRPDEIVAPDPDPSGDAAPAAPGRRRPRPLLDFLARLFGGEIGARPPRPAGPAGTPVILAPPVSSSGRDILGLVTADAVKRMFPAATPAANVIANLPFVLDGLKAHGLTDRPMVLMALATVRAETEGFVPISEGRSRFNTRVTPFDLYDAGTRKGTDLGNTRRGDGPLFRGRGYVQLTGRFNYTRVGTQLGIDLLDDPEKANDQTIAGLILGRYLANKQGAIRDAMAVGDLRQARKLVNGGSHGLDRFSDTYLRGLQLLPE